MPRTRESDFVTREQIEEEFGFPAHLLLTWSKAGRFPKPVRPSLKNYRWRRSDVEAWARQQAK